MAKGSGAKAKVVETIKQAFGKDFLGEYDKKAQVVALENGERVQVAISLTCPKTPIDFGNSVSMDLGGRDFSDEAVSVPVVESAPAEITEEEKQNIADLMAKLGL